MSAHPKAKAVKEQQFETLDEQIIIDPSSMRAATLHEVTATLADTFRRATAYVAADHLIITYEETAAKHFPDDAQKALQTYANKHLPHLRVARERILLERDYSGATSELREACQYFAQNKFPLCIIGRNGGTFETLDDLFKACSPDAQTDSLHAEFRKRRIDFAVGEAGKPPVEQYDAPPNAAVGRIGITVPEPESRRELEPVRQYLTRMKHKYRD